MSGRRAFAFGPFLLMPERQVLLLGDTVVRIGGRALDLLTALVEHPGELVTKCELLKRAWPTTTVEEGNLKVNMAALRRALDDNADAAKYIATVIGRGYRFIAQVEAREARDPSGAPHVKPMTDPGLSSDATRIFWQTDAANAIRDHRERRVCVSPVPQCMADEPAPAAQAQVRVVDLPPDGSHRADAVYRLNDLLDAVDYGIVIDGEITLVFDQTTVLLKPGSLVAQPGIEQGWANRSGRRCRMLFVLLSGQADASRAAAFA
jgi:DNA-binding winged helix-turn-helix (wHTH) protein